MYHEFFRSLIVSLVVIDVIVVIWDAMLMIIKDVTMLRVPFARTCLKKTHVAHDSLYLLSLLSYTLFNIAIFILKLSQKKVTVVYCDYEYFALIS